MVVEWITWTEQEEAMDAKERRDRKRRRASQTNEGMVRVKGRSVISPSLYRNYAAAYPCHTGGVLVETEPRCLNSQL